MGYSPHRLPAYLTEICAHNRWPSMYVWQWIKEKSWLTECQKGKLMSVRRTVLTGAPLRSSMVKLSTSQHETHKPWPSRGARPQTDCFIRWGVLNTNFQCPFGDQQGPWEGDICGLIALARVFCAPGANEKGDCVVWLCDCTGRTVSLLGHLASFWATWLWSYFT